MGLIEPSYRRYVFSLLFIALVMVGNLRFSSMYVYYSLNREGFIAQLCENKDRPELNCEGKCMLAKMLQAQNDEDERPMPIIGWEQLTVFLVKLPSYNLQIEMGIDPTSFQYSNNYSYQLTLKPHKPPIV